MNNPFEYVPTERCRRAFDELCERIERLKRSDRPEDVRFCRELEAGKMLGVLIASDPQGGRHTLYAFSGQLGDGGFYYPGFVGPVFDYLQPAGHFKTEEKRISDQNREIARFEAEVLGTSMADFEREKTRRDEAIEKMREAYRASRLEREARRQSGGVTEKEVAAMIRQSQFEKAELHRLKKRMGAELKPFADDLADKQARLEAMKDKRRADSETLQQWLFTNFRLLNAAGEWRSLSEIFAETPAKTPPSGAGECCGPKLLQAAYLRGWQPEEIAEFWYGRPKAGEVRIHGEYYPACRGKCLPVLGWMLKGLEVEPPLETADRTHAAEAPEIVFENRWFCVVNKPSGMLSVPGKGEAMSVQRWLEGRYGCESGVRVAHRLDQDTSGLLIATFGDLAFKVVQKLFAFRKVEKTYVADLEGDYEAKGLERVGHIELPLSPDWLDRPRQRVDRQQGKEALTRYEFVSVNEGRSRVIFHPLTGRTHQLRVHAASPEGLDLPIVGDRLYGKNGGRTATRLHLHAQKITFTFPIDRKTYSFEIPVPF